MGSFPLGIFFFFLGFFREGCPADFGLTNKEIAETVKLHNDARKNANPKASDINELVWDEKLAAESMGWAKQCKSEHGRTANPPYGNAISQNIGFHTSSRMDKLEPLRIWIQEKNFYNYTSNACRYTFFPCKHYTQLMWSTHTKFGCAYQLCASIQDRYGPVSNARFLVCMYYGPNGRGNMGGVKPWKAGQPCTDCRFCREGLCRDSCEGVNSCTCTRRCDYCSTLTSDCKCKCRDGLRGDTCKDLCRNFDPYCTTYSSSSCTSTSTASQSVVTVLNKVCPALCGHCKQNKDTSFKCANETYVTLFEQFGKTPVYGYQTQGGKKCVFPFVYGGVFHNSCVKKDNYTWCSQDHFYDVYKSQDKCIQIPVNGGNAGANAVCHLAFKYKNTYHHKCLTWGEKKWCATTPDYDRDGRWGYCDISVLTKSA